MIKYPNGAKQIVPSHEKKERKIKIATANRGMDFEDEINQTLAFYKDEDICLMSKRPTPINIVKVDYSHGAKIIDAYFEAQSTTDYNGVYKGRYIDIEAKSTHLNASIPLHNITPHQVEHLKMVKRHGGVAFFLISFYSALTGCAGASVDTGSSFVVVPPVASCSINSCLNSLCCVAMSDLEDTNASKAHKMKNIVANHAVAFVKKFPAAAPVNAPPNIDAADDPDIPLPSDFCNNIIPIINTDTMINNTNKIVNIFYPLFSQILMAYFLKCKTFNSSSAACVLAIFLELP